MKIKLIIFDCDGVLIESEIISARMLREEALLWGADISISHILENYVGRSYPTVLKQIQEQFELKLPDDFEAKYRARLLAAFERELKAMNGVHAFLEKLEIPFCVATSSSPERVARSLELTGLSSYFGPRIFTASQVKNEKPAPDLFLFAAKEMGVDQENCLVIEDSVMGVRAGLAAGMTTLRFTRGAHIIDKENACGAHLVFDNFENFFEIISKLKGISY